MKEKQQVFAIKGLVRGRSWNFICDEKGFYYISYDGFHLEDTMYRLRGMFPKNKYKIVIVNLT